MNDLLLMEPQTRNFEAGTVLRKQNGEVCGLVLEETDGSVQGLSLENAADWLLQEFVAQEQVVRLSARANALSKNFVLEDMVDEIAKFDSVLDIDAMRAALSPDFSPTERSLYLFKTLVVALDDLLLRIDPPPSYSSSSNAWSGIERHHKIPQFLSPRLALTIRCLLTRSFGRRSCTLVFRGSCLAFYELFLFSIGSF